MSLSFLLHQPHRAAVSAFLLLALAARAQESPPLSLTLSSALELASEQNPSLVADRFGERAAAALVEQAGFRPNPTLDVTLENFAGTGAVRGIDRLESTVQANQTFERGGKREKRLASANRDRETAAQEFAVRRNEVLARTALAYVEALAAQQRLVLAEEPLKLARETVTAVDARVSAAVSSPAESARARAGLAAAQAEYVRAKAARASAHNHLATLLGTDTAKLGTLAGRLKAPEALPPEEDFRADISGHPRLALQEAVVAGQRASLELEQSQAVQDVTIGGGVRFLRESSDAALVAEFSMPLPFRKRNQGSIRAARERLAGAEQSVHVVERELHAALIAARQDLSTAHDVVRNLQHDALPATDEAYDAVRRAYEQGQLPLIDVLDAQRALVALRRELVDARFAYATALVRIESLTDPTYATLTALLASPEHSQP